jgi:SAM-dependent methyltransferase
MAATMGERAEDYFDEQLYLEENPDVRAAVARGRQPSGRTHYLRFGRYEDRPGKPMLPNPPGYGFPGPLPPPALRRRVHDTAELSSFEWVGKNTCDALNREFAARLTLDKTSHVLDFGCGCGRVMAYFQAAVPCRLYGTDLDAEAIAWCRQHFVEMAGFSVNQPLPPLPFADAFFDAVYSISVFSHLPEEMQTAWLGELRRVTRPGGCLLLSVQGEAMLPKLSPAARAEFEDRGFLYLRRGATDGLPKFYQAAFHAEQYVCDHWGRFFEIADVVRKGIAGNQDLVVCRVPGAPAA